MGQFKKIDGTTNTKFKVGGPSGNQIKSSSTYIAARNADDSDYVNVKIKRPIENNDAATLMDVKESNILIEGGFNGGDYGNSINPGDFADTYIYCHTSGNGFEAGSIYYDIGIDFIPIDLHKGTLFSSPESIGGDEPLIQNSIYIIKSDSEPYEHAIVGVDNVVSRYTETTYKDNGLIFKQYNYVDSTKNILLQENTYVYSANDNIDYILVIRYDIGGGIVETYHMVYTYNTEGLISDITRVDV